MTPFDIAQAGFVLTLEQAAAAVLMFAIVTFVLLRIADKLSGLDFKRAVDSIEQNPTALASYLAVRYAVLGLGNALVIASVFLYA